METKTLMQTLDELSGGRRYSMFIVWYCSNPDTRETWEVFTSKNNYKNVEWTHVEQNWLLDAGVQEGIKYYMGLQHSEKMKNVYDKMVEQAMSGDVQSAKYLMDFAKDYFASDKKSELDNLLSGINLEVDSDEDE